MIMKKVFLVILMLFTSLCALHSQIETKYISKGEYIAGLHRINSSNQVIKTMPPFNLQEIREDSIKGDNHAGLYRFGKGFDVNYTLADGKWEKVEGGRLWSLTAKSENALSLNFVFNNFSLPEGADLYIENQEGTVLYGPVTHDVIPDNGIFLTDIILGEQATISIFEPDTHYNEASLTIKRVVHGYKNINAEVDKILNQARNNTSPSVACYPDYEKESDAIGTIITASGTYMCSGSLVMSTDFSFKPYFLTTYGLLDSDYVDPETDVTNGMFKFRYKELTCNSNNMATSYTYNHCNIRAGWYDTYLLLLEINGNLKANPNLTWLGWTTSGATPSSGVLLHQINATTPMSIAFDNDVLQTDYFYFPYKAWVTYFDLGYVNTCSSGSPLLDNNKRIVGHLIWGQSFNPVYLQIHGIIGKFNLSWNGGNSNSTRLSNWLDPNNTGQTTMDSYRSMIISGPSQIISSSTYSILNMPSGMSVSWSLSDSYYNQYSLQQNTPSTNKCTITKHSGHSMSGAVLTANIKKNGITVCTVTKIVSTGNGFDGTYYNGITTKQIDLPTPLYVVPGTLVTINSQNLIGATVSQNGGNATPTSWQFNSSSGILVVGMPSSVGSTVVVKVACSGGTIYNLPITTIASDSGQLMLSRAGSSIEVSLDVQSGNSWSIDVSNAITGKKVYSKEEINSSHNINTEGWKSGIYIIKATNGKESLENKIAIK